MTRLEKLYDVLMRLPIVALTAFFLAREATAIRELVASHPYFGGDWEFVSALSSRVSIVIFLGLLAALNLIRHRPVLKHVTWWPKITALLGLGLAYLLLLLPRAPFDEAWNWLSVTLIFLGTTMCILAVLDLGRSLSIMPEARRLVTHGLYARIRHPLYLFEAVATLGAYLQFRSLEAAAILIVHFGCQLQRMRWEEEVLGRAFPEYADYRKRTCKLLPGIY